LFLFTAKTGTAVYCPLSPFVIDALDAIPASAYYFWTGLSKAKSVVGDWQRNLKRLVILAGVPDGHAHRFRDTFSVELLLAGVPIERVSILLGHQSVRITEKHYAPWVRSRQGQLEADDDTHLLITRNLLKKHDAQNATTALCPIPMYKIMYNESGRCGVAHRLRCYEDCEKLLRVRFKSPSLGSAK